MDRGEALQRRFDAVNAALARADAALPITLTVQEAADLYNVFLTQIVVSQKTMAVLQSILAADTSSGPSRYAELTEAQNRSIEGVNALFETIFNAAAERAGD